jgi:hypothetical protein
MNLAKILHTATGIADGVLGFLKAPVDSITKLVAPMMDKLLDKLPFGLGSLVKPFAEKFLGSAVGWLARGPLSGVMNFLGKCEPTVEKLDGILHTLDKAVNGFIGLPPPALDNVRNIAAFEHARRIAA